MTKESLFLLMGAIDLYKGLEYISPGFLKKGVLRYE